jgi:hypothetical protein
MDKEEGEDGQQGAGKKAKLLPPTADGVENSSPEGVQVATAGERNPEGGEEEGKETNPAEKRRLTSDSFMVRQRNT